MSSATSRYSLWLEPGGQAADALQVVIDRLAQAHGGPRFWPHVTLFGSIESLEADAVREAAQFAASLAPFTVYLDDLGTGETFFQSVFATVRSTPELLAARAAAYRVFPDVPFVPFMPHLSLLYGHPSDDTKRAIIAQLQGTLPASFTARILTVNGSGPDVAAWTYPLRAELAG